MNKIFLIGRLTKDPQISCGEEESITAAKFTLAVNRKFHREGEASADFLNCTAFQKTAEFAAKYLCKGKKVAVVGHVQTGSYTNRDGRKIYTTEIIPEEIEFAESKKDSDIHVDVDENGCISIPDDIDAGLPFR